MGTNNIAFKTNGLNGIIHSFIIPCAAELLPLLLFLILSVTVPAAISGDYEYTASGDGTCTITAYTGPGGDITIPTAIYDTVNEVNLTVAIIGNYAFYHYTSLTSVTIPDSVTTIRDEAFYFCGLTSITIPDSITFIGNRVFYGCSNLIDITVDEANLVYSSIDGVLFNKIQTELIGYPLGKAGAYTIPNGVNSIGDYAFGVN